jgi:hypothetical protein
VVWTGLIWLSSGPIQGSSKQGNKPSDTIILGSFRVAAQLEAYQVRLSSTKLVVLAYVKEARHAPSHSTHPSE